MNEKPIIILDVDETLIFTKHVKEDTDLFLTSFNIKNIEYYIYKRPFLIEFLININNYFDIYIYSLGTFNYIEKILETISNILGFYPFKKVIANYPNNLFYTKTLDILDIDLDRTIIIDDRVDVWLDNLNNLYNIKRYTEIFQLKDRDDLFFNILQNYKKTDDIIYYDNNYVNLYDEFVNDKILTEDNELYKLNEIINKYFQLYEKFDIDEFKNIIYRINYELIMKVINL